MNPRGARGFTLVEVLVALVVVALGMSAVLAALVTAADSAGRLRDVTQAEWIALNQVALTRLNLSAPREGHSEADIEYANRSWRWRADVEPTEIPGLLRISVRVRLRSVGERAAPDGDAAGLDWLATAVGFRGDAVSAASGEIPDWRGRELTHTGGAGAGNEAVR
ncbi:MAG: type II secretion system minor pseudopilin GspI [Gammaproteobacteria bacterium]|nr:type II secretion system minor pseudopilin GspI [Gammaproteobacteria bacterium]